MTTRREKTEYCKLTPALLLAGLMAIIAYVYFLNMSVVHVVVQKQTLQEVQDIRNEIALLESQYIEAQHTIAARIATIDGLEAEREKLFVTRAQTSELVLNE